MVRINDHAWVDSDALALLILVIATVIVAVLVHRGIPWSIYKLLRPNASDSRHLCVYRSTDMTEFKGRVVVYSILGCPHCMQAKNTLTSMGIPYSDIRLDVFPQCREEMSRRTSKRTVPQIFFNANHIGGNDDLQTLVKNKKAFMKAFKEVEDNPPPPDAPQLPDPSTATKELDAGDVICEPDEYAELVKDLRSSGIIKNQRRGLHSYPNSFSGQDFVHWMVKAKHVEREEALEIGQHLIDKHFGHNVKEGETFQETDTLYRLLDDDESTALNAGTLSDCATRPAGEVGETVRQVILKLYSAFLSENGKSVNYKAIAASAEFKTYEKLTKELQRVQIEKASRDEKVAFFVNIYNALVIHANIKRGPPVNLWQRYKFFNTVKYIIGGQPYSLQDIENGVLRGNRKGLGMLSKPFGKSDPRLKVALEETEPMIHFALVCGAKSCPPIKTYTTKGVQEELTMAAEAFLDGDDGCFIDMNKKVIKLSQILKWYSVDFGKNTEEVLQWISNHLSGEKRNQLQELIKGRSYKVEYLKYDWNINSSD